MIKFDGTWDKKANGKSLLPFFYIRPILLGGVMGLRIGLMCVTCFLCLLLGGQPAWSATESRSYLEMRVITPENWEEPVAVHFAPDEALCVKAYGSHWRTLCSRALGTTGELAGIARLLPESEGEWRWWGDQELRFIPRVPLSPDTQYTVQLTLPALPSNVEVRPAALTFQTLPLAVAIGEDHFWIDPSPRQAHAVSCTLRFTYPVDPNDMNPRISIGPTHAASGLRLSRPQMIWNTTYDEVTLTASIEKLPQERASIEVRVSGIPRLVEEQGRKKVLAPEKDVTVPDAVYQFLIQGLSGLLHVRSAAIETGYNAELGQEYQLRLETSLHVRPTEVAKALRLFLLPRVNTSEAVIPYNWKQAPTVPADILNRATPLHIEPLQPANEPTGKMIFRIRDLSVAESVRKEPATTRDASSVFIYAWLPASFASASGIQAGQPWQQILPAAPHQARVDFLQSGNVLLLGGEQKLDLHSNGLDSIRWNIAQVREPFLALLAQPYSRFDEPPTNFSALSEVTRGEIRLPPAPSGASQFSMLDVSTLLRSGKTTKGLLFVTLDGIKDGKVAASARRFILVTDLGLMVKKSVSGIREAFVCSLASGEPAGNVVVRILAVNGMTVAAARTDASGKAVLPSVSGLRQEKRPVAIVAVQDNGGESGDLAWMPFEDAGLEVDYTSFPIAGRFSRVRASGKANPEAAGLSAYVFSQRGMYRPGETLHFGILIRKDDWGTLPPGLPLEAVLVDPSGASLSRLLTVERDGLSSVSWVLPEQAMSGRYRFHVRLPASGESGGFENLGSATVRVEAFQPDTLELKTRIVPDPGQGWLTPFTAETQLDPYVEVSLRNLYGLPAADRRIRATFSVTPTALSFSELPEYGEFLFPGTVASLTEHQEVLPECRTNKEGRVSIPLPLSRYRAGTLLCSLLVEGFEPGGGRAVARQTSLLVSSQQAVLGYRLTGEATSLDYIPQGRKAGLEWIALNAKLERISLDSLQFVVSERRSVTSLVTDAAGQYHYDETPVDRELTRTIFNLHKKTPLQWTLPTTKPGDYLLRVYDAKGNTLVTLPFMVAGEALRTPEELATGTVRLRLDKAEYEAGETIHLQLSVPYDGFGLITLERDGVVAHRWFRGKAGETMQSIVIPDNFEGRGYVNVSFVRSLASSDIYIQPHSVAVAPFTAAVRRRDMKLELRVPGQTLPGDTLLVTLTSKQPGKALIFAVDEGVLRLTDYRTPSPLDYLLRDRALEVQTMQIFDRLMPDHGRLKGRIPGFGGDMALGGSRFLNPFKRRGEPPVAFWSGVIEVNPEGTTLSIPIPDYYQGQVRVMAVGAWGGIEEGVSENGQRTWQTAGCAEATVFVRGSVGLTPQLPVAVIPGDVFEGALAINCSGAPNKKKHFVLQLETGSAFTLESAPPSVVTLSGDSETVIPFTLRVRDVPGEAVIRFIVTDTTGRSTSRSSTVSVRPAAPRAIVLTGGETRGDLDIPVQRELYPYEAVATLSVSSLPVPLMRGFSRYLQSYPYGCVEQLISRAFPYVILANRLGLLSDGERSRDKFLRQVDALIESAARATGEAFRAESGVSPWPRDAAWSTTQPNEALSVYAGDFMLSLRDSGRETFFSVPGEALFRYIEQLVSNTPGSLEQARIKAYGIWVLTREGRVTSQAVEQLIGWLETYQPGWRSDVTASFLAGSCALMRMDQEARQLIAGYTFDPKVFQADGFFDALAVQAFHAVIVARHFPDLAERTTLIRKQADIALNALRLNGFTTFSAAQGIRALAELSHSETAGTSLDTLRLFCLEPEERETSRETMKPMSPDFFTFTLPECTTFAIRVPEGSSKTSWFWQLITEGYDRHPPQEAVSHGLEVARLLLDPNTGTPLSQVRLGDEVIVSITARAHGGDISAVALVDLLPGGFEMVLPQEEMLSSGIDADRERSQPKGLIRMDRKEDRMVIFADLAVSPRNYSYRIRAVNKGRFLLPPVQAEAMYNQSVYAHSGAGEILVE